MIKLNSNNLTPNMKDLENDGSFFQTSLTVNRRGLEQRPRKLTEGDIKLDDFDDPKTGEIRNLQTKILPAKKSSFNNTKY
jgi:hypothetical protein